MYSYGKIKECYNRLMLMRGEHQKAGIDKKSQIYKEELDRRAYEYKCKIQEDARRQMQLIDRNTENYKNQVDIEAMSHKKMIDDTIRTKIESQTLTLEDVQTLLNLLDNE